YLLSSTFVPVMSVWLLRHWHAPSQAGRFSFERFRNLYAGGLRRVMPFRWVILAAYATIALSLVAWWVLVDHIGVGTEIFPKVDSGQFQLRLRAPTGTRIERTEVISKEALRAIGEAVGPDYVEITVGYVGVPAPN